MKKLPGGRGLINYTKFTDTYGAEVRVQTSSSAEGDRAWVFISGGQITMSGDKINRGSAHLTPAQARRLATALLKWAGKGTK